MCIRMHLHSLGVIYGGCMCLYQICLVLVSWTLAHLRIWFMGCCQLWCNPALVPRWGDSSQAATYSSCPPLVSVRTPQVLFLWYKGLCWWRPTGLECSTGNLPSFHSGTYSMYCTYSLLMFIPYVHTYVHTQYKVVSLLTLQWRCLAPAQQWGKFNHQW